MRCPAQQRKDGGDADRMHREDEIGQWAGDQEPDGWDGPRNEGGWGEAKSWEGGRPDSWGPGDRGVWGEQRRTAASRACGWEGTGNRREGGPRG